MDEGLSKIHSASMRILQETGIRINHPEILEIVKSNGIKISGQTAFFKEEQVMKFVAKAPGSFVLYARNPEFNMHIGGGHTEFAPGYGCPTIIETDGCKRVATFEDYRIFLKLVHQCEYFKINGGILVQPSDLQSSQSLPLMIYSTLIHSDKCLMGIPGDVNQVTTVMEMAGIVFGQEALLDKPRVLTLINTTSPLQYDKIALETLLVCVKHHQPVIISPGPMAGATGPLTLAGNIALGNAEALALIAIAQMVREGTPVVYGLQATTTDMKSGRISIGSPGCALQMVYSARLAKAYGLPSRCGGANTDAKRVSVQSGYESMLSMYTGYQAKPDLMLHSAGILDGYASMSYEQLIVDLEIISTIKYFHADVAINDETLVIDLINSAGPGGQFLTSEHTAENCRKVPWLPVVALRGTMPEGEEANDILIGNINNKLEKMLQEYNQPVLDSRIKLQLDNYLLNKVGIDSRPSFPSP